MKFLILLSLVISCFLAQATQATSAELRSLYQALMSRITNANNAKTNNLLFRTAGGAETRIQLEAGADPNARDETENTPLHSINTCISEDDPEKTRQLLEAGADPNALNIRKETPLHRAVRNNFKCAEMLLEAGADPNVRDERGHTPIQYVTDYRGKGFEVARALIEAGADPTLKNMHGDLPLIVQKHPRLLLLPKIEKTKESDCQYVNDSYFSQIEAVQCGRRSICMAEVSCLIKISDFDSEQEYTWLKRNFQAVCSSLSNGQCPEAVDCVLDRSVIEKKEEAKSSPSSSTSAPKSSSKGVR